MASRILELLSNTITQLSMSIYISWCYRWLLYHFFSLNQYINYNFFLLQEEYDTHDQKGQCSPVLPFLMKRTKVIEIVAARDVVFALAHSGLCAAFSRGSIINKSYKEIFALLVSLLVCSSCYFNALCRNKSANMLFECQPWWSHS